MPNHITNHIELIGSIEQIDAILKEFGTEVPATLSKTHDNSLLICKHKSEQHKYCWLDLKTGEVHDRGDIKQVGLPEDFEPEISQGFFCFPDFKKVIPPPSDDPAYNDLPSQKVAEKSPNWWYTWNIANWGTKWGGYSYRRIALNIFKFETAWSSVPVILGVMSERFPNLTIKYTWADEDSGYNCGWSIYKGELIEQFVPTGGSKEAYDIYFSLNPNRKSDYKLVGEKYEYVEEEA
jgi:hypothetical protein